MKTFLSLLIFAGLSATVSAPVFAAPKSVSKEAATGKLPEIWQKVSAGQRLSYVRAAEVDALRILAERVAGISLDGETTVRDLATASDSLRGQLSAVLKGVHTTEGPIFHEDGRVEVVREVKIKSLIQSVMKKSGETVATSHFTQMDTIDALGNAAIPHSLGHKRILAKRAAEMDVYRHLAERLAGVQITGETTLKDMVAGDDSLKSSFSHTLKSAEITSIAYNDDGTATVEASLKVGPLVRTIVRQQAAKGKEMKVEKRTEQMVITESGQGAAAEAPAATPVPGMQEEDSIINTVLDSSTSL